MTRDEILNGQTEICAKILGVETERCTPDARFGGDLGADGLDAIDLVVEIEARFGVALDADDSEALQRHHHWRLSDVADRIRVGLPALAEVKP